MYKRMTTYIQNSVIRSVINEKNIYCPTFYHHDDFHQHDHDDDHHHHAF